MRSLMVQPMITIEGMRCHLANDGLPLDRHSRGAAPELAHPSASFPS